MKWILSFLPGGQIVAGVAAFFRAIWKAVAWFFLWLGADIADGFKQPQRFAVRLVCMLLAFGLGGWFGIEWDRDKVDAAKQETADLKETWKKKDEEDAAKAEEAKKAREAAEAAERERITEEERKAKAAADAALAAQRVRQRPIAPAKGSQSMFNLPPLWGGSK